MPRASNHEATGYAIVTSREVGQALAGALFAAELGERGLDELVEFLVGFVLSRLRRLQGVEIRSRRIALKQGIFGQAKAGRSHVVPRNTRYKSSGAGDTDLVSRSRRKFARKTTASVFLVLRLDVTCRRRSQGLRSGHAICDSMAATKGSPCGRPQGGVSFPP